MCRGLEKDDHYSLSRPSQRAERRCSGVVVAMTASPARLRLGYVVAGRTFGAEGLIGIACTLRAGVFLNAVLESGMGAWGAAVRSGVAHRPLVPLRGHFTAACPALILCSRR